MERAALFGHPVAHSRSPGIYAELASQTRRRFEFELIDTPPDAFEARVREFARSGAIGANVTLPLKRLALELCDAASDRAARAGAVNTLRFDSRALIFGDNTDGAGLVHDLTQNLGLQLNGARILVIGAGGAAAGILGPLVDAGPFELVVANRTGERAQELAGRFAPFGRVRAATLDAPGGAYDLVINATSASMTGDVPAVPASVFGDGATAVDLYYTGDRETAFTRWAAANGAARTADGWGMLVEQAVESWRVWFGERPDGKTQLR